MEKSKREKIALVVFGLLVVLSLCGFGWYIVAGHSWNIAASTIDDTVGEMNGYTVIVYEGTLTPEQSDSESQEPADQALPSSDGVSPESDGSATPESNAAGDLDAATDADAVAEADNPAPSLLPSIGLSFFESSGEKAPVDLAALEADYREKEASTLTLDTTNLARYEEGTILKCGAKRIGVMSATPGVTQLDVAQCMQSFENADVDFTVVITPDRWKVQRITGIDIVICTENEDLLASGQTVNNTFFVDAPEIGSAGVILISPSNVVSAKEVSEP